MHKKLLIFIAALGLIQGLRGSEQIILSDNQASVEDIEDIQNLIVLRAGRRNALGSGQPRNLIADRLREQNNSNNNPRSMSVPPVLSSEQLIPLIPLEDMRDSDEDSENSEDEESFFRFIDR